MTNETPEIRALAARLDKLERQNRRVKRAGALLLLGIGILVVMGQAAREHRVIRAREFVVEDPAGVKRASFGIVGGGLTSLALYDAKSHSEMAQLSTFDGNTIFAISDSAGRSHVLLHSDDQGATLGLSGPALAGGSTLSAALSTLGGPLGEPRLSLSGGEPRISLSDANGHERANLAVTDNGPAMAFFDGPGKPRIVLAVAGSRRDFELKQPGDNVKVSAEVEPHAAMLSLYGAKSNAPPFVNLEAEEDGGGLRLADDAGFEAVVGSSHVTTAAGIRTKTSSASIALVDRNGRSIWSAP